MFIRDLRRHARPIFIVSLLSLALAGCGGGSSGGSTSAGLSITSFSPASGDPGSLVTITGTGFPTSQVEVRFGLTVMPIVSVTSTQMVVQVPTGQPDTTDNLTVETNTALATSAQQFSLYNDLYNVTVTPSTSFFAPSKFLAVGQNSTILTSSDGISWTEAGFLNEGNFNAVTASGGTVVIVGDGTIFSQTSTAGMLKRHSPTTQRLFSVTQSSTAFVAVGDNGTIIESPDGITWTKDSSPTTQPIISVVWAASQSQFVACGQNGVILNSTDGINWTLEPLSPVGTSTLVSIAFGSGTYVIVGGSGTVISSTDGSTWIKESAPAIVDSEGVFWSGTQFVVAADNSTMMTSPDGVNWTAQSLDLPNLPYLGSTAIKGGTYVTVGQTGTVVSSIDATHWTLRRGG